MISPSDFAATIRRLSLTMVAGAKGSHVGGALSMADVLAVLYTRILRVREAEPRWPERDRMLLSKGHACSALYAALALRGFFPLDILATYGREDSALSAHANHKVPGVEFSSGSLGHALPFACGKALAAKRLDAAWRIFVMLSDGELDEGSNWEAILFAPHHKLDNLVAIVDYNKIQSLGEVSRVLSLDPLGSKFEAFGWSVREVDGHDPDAIDSALCSIPWQPRHPSVLITHTTKGRGVDFMENKLLWHYSSPNDEQLRSALKQLSQKNR